MWLCKLIGHKFLEDKGGYIWPSANCYRCGYPISTKPNVEGEN